MGHVKESILGKTDAEQLGSSQKQEGPAVYRRSPAVCRGLLLILDHPLPCAGAHRHQDELSLL